MSLGKVLLIALLLLPGATMAQDQPSDFLIQLVAAAIERTTHEVRYDGSYRRLNYPHGDVPDNIGVCSDLVIRAYRAVGVDLQRLVHEDMSINFQEYPQSWGLSRPDPNIDHRRVPNLRSFLRRQKAELPISSIGSDYHAGDLVTWMLPGNLPHIGIVAERFSDDGRRPLIVHNIGAGPELQDLLFEYPITGHYRYLGPR